MHCTAQMPHTLRLTWTLTVLLGGCHVAADPPAQPANPPAHPTVKLDLSPHGIAAVIRGPDGVRAHAGAGYVEVEAGTDFHMQVFAGTLDLLVEKADIVRHWGGRFRRFVRDDGRTVLYETATVAESSYHFATTGTVGQLDYYCRSVEGVSTLEAAERMIAGCRSIRAQHRVISRKQ